MYWNKERQQSNAANLETPFPLWLKHCHKALSLSLSLQQLQLASHSSQRAKLTQISTHTSTLKARFLHNSVVCKPHSHSCRRFRAGYSSGHFNPGCQDFMLLKNKIISIACIMVFPGLLKHMLNVFPVTLISQQKCLSSFWYNPVMTFCAEIHPRSYL